MTTQDSTNTLHVGTARALPHLLRFGVRALLTLVLAILMCRALYTTRPGIFLVDQIPAAFWDWYEGAVGLEGWGMVEDVQNAQALPLFVLCVIFSAGVLWLLECSYRAVRR
jgi:hypothetical protein